MLGGPPIAGPAQLARVGYLAQDAPLYAGLPVADHLRLGAHLNPGWDADMARGRVERLGLDPRQKAGTLSGGQRAQLALTLAVAKRPELLILDEPVASLDPLARREFLQDLMEAVAEQQVSVVLSSHLISDLERACDYVIVLVDSTVRLAGPVDDLLGAHHLLYGPRRDPASLPDRLQIISAMAVTEALSLIQAWWAAPIGKAVGLGGGSSIFSEGRFGWFVFPTHGITPLGYAAFGFALGVTAGLLARRPVPAMAITLAIFAAVQFITPLWIRPHLFPTSHTTATIAAAGANVSLRPTPGWRSPPASSPASPEPGSCPAKASTPPGSRSAPFPRPASRRYRTPSARTEEPRRVQAQPR